MVIEVTRIGGDGSIRRAVVDTAGREDAARSEQLAQQAALEAPPYRPEPALEEQRSKKYRHGLITVVSTGVRAGQLGGTDAWLSSHLVSHA
jgi:hypothetical protein